MESLGFIERTAARRISPEDAQRLEKIHEDLYGEWGYQCVKVPVLAVNERAQWILDYIDAIS